MVQLSWKAETTSHATYSLAPDEPDQAYYWTAEWQQGEKEADSEIRSGKTRRFSCAEEAIAWLRG
jgi:hypothetical protein